MQSATPSEAIQALIAAGETVATCESLTGGLICGALTDVPGSSAVVRGGLVTYATDLKTTLAGVDAPIIHDCGVVSREVAKAMARGVRVACQSDWGVAVTGVAGPGRADGVPAGTVWLAVAGPDALVVTRLDLPGDRREVRCQTVSRALDLLIACVTRRGETQLSAAPVD